MMKKLILITTLIMGLFITNAFPITANTAESVIVLKRKAKSQQTKSTILTIKAYLNDNSLTIYFLTPLKAVNITIKNEFGNIVHSEQ